MKTINSIIVTHALFITLFAGVAIAFAQNSDSTESATTLENTAESNTNSPAERQAKMETLKAETEQKNSERQTQIDERQSEVKADVVERRTALQERAQKRISNLAANISNHMEAAIKRIQNIIDRIDTRIDKLAERGVDTSKAKISLASAQSSINAALAKMATIDEDVAVAVGSEDVRDNWAAVRANYVEIRDHLKTAHTELRATVSAIKTAVSEAQLENGVSDAVRANLDTATKTEETTN